LHSDFRFYVHEQAEIKKSQITDLLEEHRDELLSGESGKIKTQLSRKIATLGIPEIHFSSSISGENLLLFPPLGQNRENNRPADDWNSKCVDYEMFSLWDLILSRCVTAQASLFFDNHRKQTAVSALWREDDLLASYRDRLRNLILSFAAVMAVILITIRILTQSSLVEPIAISSSHIRFSGESTNPEDLANKLESISTPFKEVRILFGAMAEYSRRVTTLEGQITQRKIKEATLEMARSVAHDIRAPLTALRLALAEMSSEGEPKRKNEALAIIKSAITRINSIAEDLLNSTRTSPVTATLPITETWIDTAALQTTLRQLIDEINFTLTRGKRSLRVRLNENNIDANLRAQVDPGKLARAVSNIIHNSLEAVDPRDGEVLISLQKAGNYFLISVYDNGKGIEPSVLAKLGQEPITSGKERYSGNGLGLWECFRIAREFGGNLQIQSKPGQGTLVELRLPLLPLSPASMDSEQSIGSD
jgi:signal transduction histidine kinase